MLLHREFSVLSPCHLLGTLSPSLDALGDGALEAQFGGIFNSVDCWTLGPKSRTPSPSFCWVGHRVAKTKGIRLGRAKSLEPMFSPFPLQLMTES